MTNQWFVVKLLSPSHTAITPIAITWELIPCMQSVFDDWKTNRSCRDSSRQQITMKKWYIFTSQKSLVFSVDFFGMLFTNRMGDPHDNVGDSDLYNTGNMIPDKMEYI